MKKAEKEYDTCLGVIGGSGVYQIEGVEVVGRHEISTPWGSPSDKVIEARIDNRSVFFLPRHGVGHRYTPAEVPYRANIAAMKSLGVTHLLAVSAVGIMQEQIQPGHMVVPDQIFDRTKDVRPSTFFGDGIVAHLPFADPFDEEMRGLILAAAQAKTENVHAGGTYICMEGPLFSTRAESEFYRRTLEPAVIGMTAIPEAKLAREAELCYGMLALATDYDCWHEEEEDVTVEAVVAVLAANAKLANSIVGELARSLPRTSRSPSLEAAKGAFISDLGLLPAKRREELMGIFGRYLG